MSTRMCKYKAGLELARYKSRHLLVWHGRGSLFTQKAHVDQTCRLGEKYSFVFSSQDYSHEEVA